MAARFVIPSIFTAVDKLSPAVARMETHMARLERQSTRTGGAMGAMEKEVLSLVSKAALIGAAFQGIRFGINSIVEYETALHSLEAVTGETADKFKPQIESIATATRKSVIDVAKSFEVIGSAMSQYLDNPEALGQIAEAGITLSKASRMELEPTLQALTSVMNQFDISADGAVDTINRLTAGEIVGSVSTAKIAEHLQQFGAVAKANNVTISESVSLLEVLGKKLPAEKLGTAARNIVTFMSAIKGMPKEAIEQLEKYEVSLDLVSDSTKPFGERLKELSKIQGDAVAMEKFFGRENIAAGTTIFQQLPLYDKWTSEIAATNKASEQAAVNSNTLANATLEVSNSFVNALVSGDKLTPTLELIKSLALWVSRNMESILGIVFKVAAGFLAWKAALLLMNATLAISKALSSAFFLVDMVKYIAATRGISIATAAWSVIQSSLNAAMLANPIGMVLGGLILLTTATWAIVGALKEKNAVEKAAESIRKRAMDNTIDQRVEVSLLFNALRKVNAGTKEYSDLLVKIDALQPGIVEKYNLTAGAIQNINQAEKDLTQSIMKRAEAEAKAELLREKTRQFIEGQMNGPSMMQNFLGGFGSFGGLGGQALFLRDQAELQKEIKAIADYEVPTINPQETQQQAMGETFRGMMSGNINVNVNDPNNRTDWKSSAPGINIKTTSTVGSF